jgi:transposase-like protein
MAKKELEKSMSQNNGNRNRQSRYFSEDARRQIVKEIEDGLYSKSEASRVYNVSHASIYNWLHKYSLKFEKQMIMVVELESESVKRKKLEQQINDLQKLVGHQAAENYFYEQLIDFMSEHYEFDFKKNINTKSSDELELIKRKFGK